MFPKALVQKYTALQRRLAELGSAIVAFSGGVDSTLLLRVAHDVMVRRKADVAPRLSAGQFQPLAHRPGSSIANPLLLRGVSRPQAARGVPGAGKHTPESPLTGKRSGQPRVPLVAVTACSCTYPAQELAAAKKIAAGIGVRHLVVHTDEMADGRFAANPRNRCFFCKSELFRKLRQIARERGIAHVLDATNADDLRDFRPGRKAAAKFHVVSPLLEAGFTKRDIRLLARKLGLPNWNEPAHACLASRVPYGTRIAPAVVRRIELAEAFIASLGFSQIRVRDHWPVARIELAPAEIPRAMRPRTRARIVAELKKLGYTFITMDMQGYRTGSLNETIDN